MDTLYTDGLLSMDVLAESFLAEATCLQDQIVAWRRDLHQHPELGFQEIRTGGIVAAELRRLGLEVATGVGQTGVMGILSGDADGPTILVRCDMDALPIEEVNEVAYRSQTPGTMHACGHDGHTAIGLAVANLLHARRSQIAGRIKFIFQPAEEIAGGANAMIADGVLADPAPDLALGIHLWNTLPVGQVGLGSGPVMAGAAIFEVVISGWGGHGASPHEARDPLLAAAQVVTALQSVVSRNVNPLDSAVLSVTSFDSGTAYNVIPPEARLKGTIRAYRPDVFAHVVERLEGVAQGVAEAMGCEAVVSVTQLTPPLVNDPEVTASVARAIAPYVEPDGIRSDIRTMGAEDMSIFLDKVPGCFLMVGSANAERQLDFPHHHPRFDFDEAALPLGAAMLASAVAAYVIPA